MYGLNASMKVVGLRLGGSLVASVARVVVAAEQLAGCQRLVGVPAEALVGVLCAAGRLHDDEVTTGHAGYDKIVLPRGNVDAVKPHGWHRPSG